MWDSLLRTRPRRYIIVLKHTLSPQMQMTRAVALPQLPLPPAMTWRCGARTPTWLCG